VACEGGLKPCLPRHACTRGVADHLLRREGDAGMPWSS
jgi:hypothetical protein